MEREILFEVRRFDNKEIVGFERINTDGHWEHIRPMRDEWLLGAITDGQEYSKFIRRQFTGLSKSKNHPMFDDRIKLMEDDIFILADSNTKYRVIFDNYEWIGISNEGDDWGKYKYRIAAIKGTIRIVGNIHDNPELL